jgi:hypothetical protein
MIGTELRFRPVPLGLNFLWPLIKRDDYLFKTLQCFHDKKMYTGSVKLNGLWSYGKKTPKQSSIQIKRKKTQARPTREGTALAPAPPPTFQPSVAAVCPVPLPFECPSPEDTDFK